MPVRFGDTLADRLYYGDAEIARAYAGDELVYDSLDGYRPLDLVGTAALAYSLRRLSTAYTGPTARVRRSSDNAEADVMPDEFANGTFASWLGGATGSVRVWYDQSGGGYDASVGSVAAPTLTLDGTLGRYVLLNSATSGLVVPGVPYSRLMAAGGTVLSVQFSPAAASNSTTFAAIRDGGNNRIGLHAPIGGNILFDHHLVSGRASTPFPPEAVGAWRALSGVRAADKRFAYVGLLDATSPTLLSTLTRTGAVPDTSGTVAPIIGGGFFGFGPPRTSGLVVYARALTAAELATVAAGL